MKAGNTIRPSSVESTVLQTNTGSRVKVNPGARILSTVTNMFIPPTASENPNTMIVKQYASMPSAAWSASGE